MKLNTEKRSSCAFQPLHIPAPDLSPLDERLLTLTTEVKNLRDRTESLSAFIAEQTRALTALSGKSCPPQSCRFEKVSEEPESFPLKLSLAMCVMLAFTDVLLLVSFFG